MDELVIAGRRFSSRLFLGTGKFPSVVSLRDPGSSIDLDFPSSSIL